MDIRSKLISGIVASFCLATQVMAQTSAFSQPHARILGAADESMSVTLSGNVHPLVTTTAEGDSKPIDESTPMEHMILHLKGDAAQDAQLAQLLAEQKDPKSPLYHRYLTPQDFGVSPNLAPPPPISRK